MGPRLREISLAARGSQAAESCNLYLFLLSEIVGHDDLLPVGRGQVLDVLEGHRRRADPRRLGVAVEVQHGQLHPQILN